jgi:hypothetical protein
MPTNHGIYRKRIEDPAAGRNRGPDQVGVFRNGMSRIFEALSLEVVTPARANQEKAVQLMFHYKETSRRLVFSMQRLNTLAQAMAAEYNHQSPSPTRQSLTMLEAGCYADHIFTYLNSIVDDIACAIIHSTGFSHPNPARPIDSMGGLKGVAADNFLSPFSALLAELDNAGSWWELAFKPKVGGRQLLIHNQHFVAFAGSGTEGQPIEVGAFLMSPFAQNPLRDFFGLLRGTFASLFDWLDRMEEALTNHLCAKSNWVPDAKCPSFALPVGYPSGTTHFHPDYFVMPLCVGSDPLPWKATVSLPRRGRRYCHSRQASEP